MADKNQGQGMSVELEKAFLDDSGKVDLSRVQAEPLPNVKFNSTKQFKELFAHKQGKFGTIKTPYKDVRVDMGYAYRHFYQNTNNVNRNFVKSAFFDTLQNPLFVAEKERAKNMSVYFYKVYEYENDKVGVFGIGIDDNGEVEFKTFYADKGNSRIKQMLKLSDENIKHINKEALTNANYPTR